VSYISSTTELPLIHAVLHLIHSLLRTTVLDAVS
jgi:hypothetical protein